MSREPWFADLQRRIEDAAEPFLIPDVQPPVASPAEVFHAVRDRVDDGTLTHGPDGYRRAASSQERAASSAVQGNNTTERKDEMDVAKLGFTTCKVVVTDSQIRLQIENIEGDKLEVELGVAAHPFDGTVEFTPIRHFGDPDSVPWFKDSISWSEWYKKTGLHSSS